MKLTQTFAMTLTSVALVASTGPAHAVAAGSTEGATVSAAASSTSVKKRLSQLIADLPLKAESSKSGYGKAKFKHWIDANRDCQNTRNEVLTSESKKKVTGRCAVKTGRWVSAYDQKVITKASKIEIDHVVPLVEAWVSGAKKWDADTRRRFANDLGEHRALAAVSVSSNRAKGDQDPAAWLPEHKVCAYITNWTVVKTRWGLSASRQEKQTLLDEADSCTDKVVRLTKTKIVKAGTAKKSTPKASGGGTYTPRGNNCPSSHPIKGNANSMIYHVPSGSFYTRTNPEECFASEADARRAGYRRSKV